MEYGILSRHSGGSTLGFWYATII